MSVDIFALEYNEDYNLAHKRTQNYKILQINLKHTYGTY